MLKEEFNIMNTLYQLYLRAKENAKLPKSDSQEFTEQSAKCEKLHLELRAHVSEEQKIMLNILCTEHIVLSHILEQESFAEGLEAGFKTALRFLVGGLTDT